MYIPFYFHKLRNNSIHFSDEKPAEGNIGLYVQNELAFQHFLRSCQMQNSQSR